MPSNWQFDRLPKDAIPVEERLPENHVDVIVWISDQDVAIHHYPTIARRDRTAWWSGVPGKYIALHNLRWTVTHWLPLPDGRPA